MLATPVVASSAARWRHVCEEPSERRNRPWWRHAGEGSGSAGVGGSIAEEGAGADLDVACGGCYVKGKGKKAWLWGCVRLT